MLVEYFLLLVGVKFMLRLLPFISLLFVVGCSLPAGVSAVSWAIDGASYITTKKSLTDHGLSFLAGQDCALYRFVTGNDVCQNYEDPFIDSIQITDASDAIESQISQLKKNEIFYTFDMSSPINYAVLNKKKIIQGVRIYLK